jgi:hypothetical protein
MMGLIPLITLIMISTHNSLSVYTNVKLSNAEVILCVIILTVSYVIGFNLADRSTETKEMLELRKEGMGKFKFVFSSVGFAVLMWFVLVATFIFLVLK